MTSSSSVGKNISLAEVIQEKWLRGDLSFKLHAAQKVINSKLAASSSKLFVINCSRQFGKSFLMVVKAIELALKQKKARIKYGAAFQTDLIEFIIPAFNKILEDCPHSVKPKFTKVGSKWVFPNGSEIKLVGLDKNPNGLRGNTPDGIFIDEAGFVSNLDYIYKSVLLPATTHKPNCKIVLISTPPATPAHSFVDYALRAQKEGNYAEFTIYDNPMVSTETIKLLMEESGGEKSTSWKREYLCQFITDANSVICPEWNDSFIQDIVKDSATKYYHRYVSMDLGVKDNTAVLFGYYDFLRASLVIEDEFIVNGPTLTTEKLQTRIKEIEKATFQDIKPYLRVSDNNNPLLLQDLSELHNLPFVPTDKGSLEEMVNTLRILVGAGKLIIHPRCVNLIGCLKYGVWDKSRKQFARSNVYGHFDALASLIYLVRNLNKGTNPIPSTFGYDLANSMYFPHQKNQSQTAKSLSKAFNRKKAS